jgi:hypothetical protein
MNTYPAWRLLGRAGHKMLIGAHPKSRVTTAPPAGAARPHLAAQNRVEVGRRMLPCQCVRSSEASRRSAAACPIRFASPMLSFAHGRETRISGGKAGKALTIRSRGLSTLRPGTRPWCQQGLQRVLRVAASALRVFDLGRGHRRCDYGSPPVGHHGLAVSEDRLETLFFVLASNVSKAPPTRPCPIAARRVMVNAAGRGGERDQKGDAGCRSPADLDGHSQFLDLLAKRCRSGGSAAPLGLKGG